MMARSPKYHDAAGSRECSREGFPSNSPEGIFVIERLHSAESKNMGASKVDTTIAKNTTG